MFIIAPMYLPVLYSYRRCPYAMRARMALHFAGIQVEMREIALKNKPQHMLEVSPKGTVPILVLANGSVIDESLDIMRWALTQKDSEDWQMADDVILQQAAASLIAENDAIFKQALDRYKYAIRYPEQPLEFYRAEGEVFLDKLEGLLKQTAHLCRNSRSLADIAIFPFVRQFAAVDEAWFVHASYPKLRAWLNELVQSALFLSVMEKQPTWID
jgi:glutathione S-transferase